MKKRSQTGIAHLGLLLLLLVIVIVALIGYKVWNNHRNTSASTQGTASIQSTGQAINSTADLNQAETQLNATNIDNDLNPNSFNQDTQSLL